MHLWYYNNKDLSKNSTHNWPVWTEWATNFLRSTRMSWFSSEMYSNLPIMMIANLYWAEIQRDILNVTTSWQVICHFAVLAIAYCHINPYMYVLLLKVKNQNRGSYNLIYCNLTFASLSSLYRNVFRLSLGVGDKVSQTLE